MNSKAITELVTKHLTAWSERAPAKSEDLVEKIYDREPEFIDPFLVINGVEKLDGFVTDLQA